MGRRLASRTCNDCGLKFAFPCSLRKHQRIKNHFSSFNTKSYDDNVNQKTYRQEDSNTSLSHYPFKTSETEQFPSIPSRKRSMGGPGSPASYEDSTASMYCEFWSYTDQMKIPSLRQELVPQYDVSTLFHLANKKVYFFGIFTRYSYTFFIKWGISGASKIITCTLRTVRFNLDRVIRRSHNPKSMI